MPEGTGGYPWWNDAVFYEIFVRSFYDSNGDGIGDFNGLTQKLDYLNDGKPKTTTDLGVTGLWLMPIHPTKSYHGYDVTDYYNVNPDYGSLDDFKRLLAEAHKRGMRVIIDLVLNHTSCQHPWFQSAQDLKSPYRNWYVWSDMQPAGGGWHASPTGYYFGMFQDCMPDLNYEEPAVIEEMNKVARFWLEEVGVDGFRLDAAKHLVEEGTNQANTPSTHKQLKAFHSFVTSVNPDAMTVGEVWDASSTVAEYITNQELDLAFNFDLAQAMVLGARNGKANEISRLLERDWELFPAGQYASFLTNHDQNRTASMLIGNTDKAKSAASLLLTLPGAPFIYYGEEIGMLGQKPDELIRTPMQWTAEANGGFTNASPWEAVNEDYQTVNVAAQDQEPASLLAHYRALVQLRNKHAALRIGSYLPVQTGTPSLLAFLRISQDPQEIVLVLINLSKEAVKDYQLSLDEGPLTGTYKAVWLLSPQEIEDQPVNPPTLNSKGGFDAYQPMPEVAAYSTLVIRLIPGK